MMSAEGMLDDPCLFAGPSSRSGASGASVERRKVEKKIRQVQKLLEKQKNGVLLSPEEEEKVKKCKDLKQQLRQLTTESNESVAEKKEPMDGLAKARQYLSIVNDYPPSPPLSTLIFHCRRMAKAELTAFQMLEDFKQAQSLEEVHQLLTKAEEFRDAPGSFQASKEKEEKDRELRKQQAYELECRRKFEQRMARKAARLKVPLAEVMKGSAVPGGSLSFNSEPSWLTEKGDMTDLDSKKVGKKTRGVW